MPIELLKKLPKKARKIYETVYTKAKSDGKSASEAAMIAIGAVKRNYKQTKTKKWITKSTALKTTILKSGFFNKTLKFRIPLTNTKIDSEGQRVSPKLINKIYNSKLIKTIGDVEHEGIAKKENKLDLRKQLTDLTGTNGLYLLEDISKSDDGELEALVVMNKSHPLYETMINKHKHGEYLYASAEWNNAKLSDDESVITDADSLGWTITNSPIGDLDKVRQVIAC